MDPLSFFDQVVSGPAVGLVAVALIVLACAAARSGEWSRRWHRAVKFAVLYTEYGVLSVLVCTAGALLRSRLLVFWGAVLAMVFFLTIGLRLFRAAVLWDQLQSHLAARVAVFTILLVAMVVSVAALVTAWRDMFVSGLPS